MKSTRVIFFIGLAATMLTAFSVTERGEADKDSAHQTVQPATASASYAVEWYVIDASGGQANSIGFKLRASAGQPTIGTAKGIDYRADIGYLHGVPGGGGCQCPYQSDFDEDGFLTALDLSVMIDILFAGANDLQDPTCSSPRADFDCDGFSTALDLASLIDHLFAGGNGPCDPCAP